jgi:hypothetical protein
LPFKCNLQRYTVDVTPLVGSSGGGGGGGGGVRYVRLEARGAPVGTLMKPFVSAAAGWGAVQVMNPVT